MKYYRQLQPIQAMSFDLDDTLYDNRPVIARLTREANAWLHQQHPIAATRDEAWWLKLKLDLGKQDTWLHSDVTLWRHRTTKLGLMALGYSEPQAEQAADDLLAVVFRLRSDFSVPDMTHKVMAELAEKYPLVAITNGNVDVERIGLSDYFSLILRAGRDGYAKPHTDMFAKAQQYLSVKSGAILHVGDHLKTDVLGAKQNGFQTCWYNDQGVCIRKAKHSRVLPDIEINTLESLLML